MLILAGPFSHCSLSSFQDKTCTFPWFSPIKWIAWTFDKSWKMSWEKLVSCSNVYCVRENENSFHFQPALQHKTWILETKVFRIKISSHFRICISLNIPEHKTLFFEPTFFSYQNILKFSYQNILKFSYQNILKFWYQNILKFSYQNILKFSRLLAGNFRFRVLFYVL